METVLHIQNYCQGCEDIEPVADSIMTYDGSYVVITCMKEDVCKRMEQRLMENIQKRSMANELIRLYSDKEDAK